MRTFSRSASTRLLSRLQCYKFTQRQVSASSVIRDSIGFESISYSLSNHTYPRPHNVSCVVLHQYHSNPLLNSSYREACPNTRSTNVAIHVITRSDTAQSSSDPHCPGFNHRIRRAVRRPVHCWGPNRRFPVLGEIERVATNVVLHQHSSRR